MKTRFITILFALSVLIGCQAATTADDSSLQLVTVVVTATAAPTEEIVALSTATVVEVPVADVIIAVTATPLPVDAPVEPVATTEADAAVIPPTAPAATEVPVATSMPTPVVDTTAGDQANSDVSAGDVTAPEIDPTPESEFDLPISAVPVDFESVILWLTEQSRLNQNPAELRAMMFETGNLLEIEHFQVIDMDGDGVSEWAVSVNDPDHSEFGDGSGDYVIVNPDRLVYRYSLDSSVETPFVGQLPLLQGLLDLNGDGLLDTVISSMSCGIEGCFSTVDAVGSRDEGIGSMIAITDATQPTHSFAELSFDDETGDGLPDVAIRGGTTIGIGGGRADRATTQIWGWDATADSMQLIRIDVADSNLRFHKLADANVLFDAGLYAEALPIYQQVVDDMTLDDVEGFLDPGTTTLDDTRQFGLFRIMLVEALLDLPMESGRTKDRLLAEYPGDVMTSGAVSFYTSYFLFFEVTDGCDLATDFFVTQANPAGEIENMGAQWPLLSAETICPIRK